MGHFQNQVFYLYILQSEKTSRYYVGSTHDLDDRLMRHNGGRSKATKSGVPWRLAYTEKFASKTEAYRRELEIKSWKTRILIEELIAGENSD